MAKKKKTGTKISRDVTQDMVRGAASLREDYLSFLSYYVGDYRGKRYKTCLTLLTT